VEVGSRAVADNVFLYRQEAERLRRAAESIVNAELRRQYLDVALQYDQLADSITPKRPGVPES
jgi:hypothetical protein